MDQYWLKDCHGNVIVDADSWKINNVTRASPRLYKVRWLGRIPDHHTKSVPKRCPDMFSYQRHRLYLSNDEGHFGECSDLGYTSPITRATVPNGFTPVLRWHLSNDEGHLDKWFSLLRLHLSSDKGNSGKWFHISQTYSAGLPCTPPHSLVEPLLISFS